jgi:UDPglucose 6-dehydrogenase
VCRALAEERARLAVTDPRALDNARRDLAGVGDVEFEEDPYRAAAGAHAIVLLTDWPEYARLDYGRLFESMEKPAFLFDGRGRLDHRSLFETGFNVHAVGKKPLSHLAAET